MTAVRGFVFDAYGTLFDVLWQYPLAILSNGIPRMLQAVLEHNRLQGVFAQVLSVDPLRTFKPNPVVYELAPRQGHDHDVSCRQRQTCLNPANLAKKIIAPDRSVWRWPT